MELSQVLEALLFASPRPLSLEEVRGALRGALELTAETGAAELARARDAEILRALLTLQLRYQEEGRSFRLEETAAGWQLTTVAAFAPWVRQLYPADQRSARLSAPALETLAVIAYRQPLIRADVEAVRGVDVGGVLQTLLDRGLVKIAGRAGEVPGRPLLYGTTDFFLEHFGLKTLDELPNCEELRRVPLPRAPEKALPDKKPGAAAAPAPGRPPAAPGPAAGPTP